MPRVIIPQELHAQIDEHLSLILANRHDQLIEWGFLELGDDLIHAVPPGL
jgi:hypothetical protein